MYHFHAIRYDKNEFSFFHNKFTKTRLNFQKRGVARIEGIQAGTLSRKEKYKQERMHPIVLFLLFGTAFTRMAVFMSLPFLSFYLTKQMHLEVLQVSTVLGMAGLGGAIGGLIGGPLSDFFGRRFILWLSMILWTFVFFGFMFARDYYSFIGLSLAHGLSRSFFDPASQALMADLTIESKRLKIFGYRYTALNVGMVTGPLLGTYLYEWVGIYTFFFTGIAFALYTLLLIVTLRNYQQQTRWSRPKESTRFSSFVRVLARDRSLGYYIMGSLLFYIVYSQMETNLPIYLYSLLSNGENVYPLLIAINALMVILLQGLVASWAENKNPLSSVILGCFIFALGYASFAIGKHASFFIIGIVLFTFGEMLIFPITNKMIDQLADDRYRGAYYGIGNLAQAGLFLGPMIGGWMFKQVGAPLTWWVIVIISLHIIWFYAMGYRRYRQKSGVGIAQIVYRVLYDLRLASLIKFSYKMIPLISFLLGILFIASRYFGDHLSFMRLIDLFSTL